MSVGRGDLRNALIDGGAEGIDVRPGALFALGAVLFQRRITRFQYHRHAALIGVVHEPSGAEVHQLQATVGQHHDVVRADVPMDDALLVYLLQGTEDRLHEPEDLVCAE